MGIAKELISRIRCEAENASDEFGPFKSPHEAYGVLKEEFEEWWDSIKKNEFDDYELLQVISVGYRYLLERASADKKVLDSIWDKQLKRWLHLGEER